MTKSPILPSEGSQRGGRLNEQPLQHHMGVKYGCCIKRGQGVRQYVMHPYNKLSVCGHDEMREREKGTVMAFWDDRDMQGSVRREVECYRKSLVKSIPTAAVFIHSLPSLPSAFQKKMAFKQFDRSQRDFQLFRQTLEFDFVPFNLTLVQKIAHCHLERIFGGWFFFFAGGKSWWDFT